MNTHVGRIGQRQARLCGLTAFPSPSPEALADEDDDDGANDDDEDEDASSSGDEEMIAS